MIEKSLIICYSTPNYDKLTKLFKSSLLSIGVKIENIEHYLDEQFSMNDEKTGFESQLWYNCVLKKHKYLIDILEQHKSYEFYIFSDCDIWFLENKEEFWNSLEKHINQSKHDIFFMRERLKRDVNSGFIIIKNNANLQVFIDFFKKIYEIMLTNFSEGKYSGNQILINKYKAEINFGFIPNEYIIWGKIIFNKQKALLHHAVCCKDVEDKLTQIQFIKNRIKK